MLLVIILHLTEIIIPFYLEVKFKLKSNKRIVSTARLNISLTLLVLFSILSVYYCIYPTIGILIYIGIVSILFNRTLFINYLEKKEEKETFINSIMCTCPIINVIGYYKLLQGNKV